MIRGRNTLFAVLVIDYKLLSHGMFCWFAIDPWTEFWNSVMYELGNSIKLAISCTHYKATHGIPATKSKILESNLERLRSLCGIQLRAM